MDILYYIPAYQNPLRHNQMHVRLTAWWLILNWLTSIEQRSQLWPLPNYTLVKYPSFNCSQTIWRISSSYTSTKWPVYQVYNVEVTTSFRLPVRWSILLQPVLNDLFIRSTISKILYYQISCLLSLYLSYNYSKPRISRTRVSWIFAQLGQNAAVPMMLIVFSTTNLG